jgi:alanyl-tRNA synthetase
VIADHIRTLGFAIADGILPGNTDRNYVLRRILRRAVRYGRSLGFHEPFFFRLVDVLAETMGEVFPEIQARRDHVEDVIRVEEEAFNRTLDRGLQFFEDYVRQARRADPEIGQQGARFQGEWAFTLYDTYGFPLDLTELMARERGLSVDAERFDRLMEAQRARARAAQKKEVVAVSEIQTDVPTRFVGYETLAVSGKVLEVVRVKDRSAVVCDVSPFYAEMGGQVGDTGEFIQGGALWRVVNTQKIGDAWLHLVAEDDAPLVDAPVDLVVDRGRRAAIQRHHTVTHLLHWALHEVLGPEVSQKGSYVGPEKLTFDFNSAALTPDQVSDVERLVNERVLENAPVTWIEVKYDHVRDRRDIMQFFGEKYGDWVRVVQIGGKPTALDGYSMELCGGTHCRATGEIGLFRIGAESAIAAGIRRIEAVSGLEAYRKANDELQLIRNLAGKVNSPVGELEKKIEALLAQQKELERQLKGLAQKQAAELANALLSKVKTLGEIPALVEEVQHADGEALQAIANELRGRFEGVLVLGGVADSAVALVISVSASYAGKIHAGKIIQQIAPLVGGKGGGRADNARGGGKETANLGAALAKAIELIGTAH